MRVMKAKRIHKNAVSGGLRGRSGSRAYVALGTLPYGLIFPACI